MINPRNLLVAGILFASLPAWAVPSYRVTAQFVHLGEVIASPQMEVLEGEAYAGHWAVEGSPKYKVVVKVNPATAEQVYVSLQLLSGNLDIQPNLLVTIGEMSTATVDNKVLVHLLVEELEE